MNPPSDLSTRGKVLWSQGFRDAKTYVRPLNKIPAYEQGFWAGKSTINQGKNDDCTH